MQAVSSITEAQSLAMILALEGMPEELPLLVDSPDYVNADIKYIAQQEHIDGVPLTSYAMPPNRVSTDDEDYNSHTIATAFNLDVRTPVDTFMESQQPAEYRWQDDCKELAS